jgi:NADH:ubiquinone oxidoreductase subunit E
MAGEPRGASTPGAEARAGRFPGPSLIPPLMEIQRRHGWLPRDELVAPQISIPGGKVCSIKFILFQD